LAYAVRNSKFKIQNCIGLRRQEFKIQNSKFKIALAYAVRNSKFKIQNCIGLRRQEFKIQNSELKPTPSGIQNSEFKIQNCIGLRRQEFKIQNSEFKISQIMLNKIINFSLNNKLFVLLGAALLIAGGVYTSQKMDIDVLPDLTAPTAVIMTDARGMAAEEVERLVTFPIEAAVNGATDVRRVRSSSMQGYSFVWVEFGWGTDVFKARQIVSEKMSTLAASLPAGVTPALAPQSSIMGEILFIGLQADSTSMMALRALADWVVKPAILATGGVAQVTVIGGDYKQYQLLADPQRMDAYGVTMRELEATGRAMSANSSGGIVRDYGNEYVLRGVARTGDLDELGATLVKTVGGKPVVVADVADVAIGSAPKLGYASQNAKPAIILSVSKQPNVNTLNVTRSIESNLSEVRKALPPDVAMDTKIFRQADFIEASVSNVGRTLLEGALFVVVILLLFLGSFRTTVISVIAIPLSLLGSVIVLHLLGMNINTMTLGGMCIAIGSLVDDAIIDVENVYKRLRQRYRSNNSSSNNGGGMSAAAKVAVIFEASREIRASILNATLIIIVAFTPLFFLSGMEGRMLKPLGVAYIVALFTSLVVAMTVTPLLCRLMLSSDRYLEKNERDSWLTRKLASLYGTSLSWALRNKRKALYPTVAAFAAAAGLFFCMGRSFLPEFNEGSLVIAAVTQPGVSLEEGNRLGNLMERELLQIPEVVGTARRTGRGELDEHSQASNSSEIDVNFRLADRPREAFMADVRRTLAGVPGVATTVGQPLGHRIDHILSGTRANIAIKIFGPDLSRLFALGNRIQGAIQDVDGLVDVSVEQQTETPQLQIRANRGMLARYGITVEDFNRYIETAFAGEKLADIYEGQRSFDLVLRLVDAYTGSVERVKSALIDTESGRKVPLEEVADIASVGGPSAISRENVQRKLVVSANVSGRDLKSAADEVKARIAQAVSLPEGYRVEYGGQLESAASASRTLLIATLAALGVIFLLLYGELKNATLSAVVLLNLPLALIGGVAAVFFTSSVVSIPSIIGFITLFGIATRNGILLISSYERRGADGSPKKEEIRSVVLQGSLDRLNPILMTALTAALALIPLVLQGDKPGNEIQSPMAVVVLGGLLTSTLLNIYIVPIAYELVKRGGLRKLFAKLFRRVGGAKGAAAAIALCCIATALPAAGQGEVEAVLREVEANNATLSALREQAEAQKLGNRTGIYPANPEVEYSYFLGSPSPTGNRTDISVRQQLDFPAAYVHRSRIADAENANVAQAYKSARAALLLGAKQTCIALAYSNALAREYAARLQSAEQLAEMYKARLAAGDADVVESNKVQLSLAAVRREAAGVATEQAALRLELRRLNGGKEAPPVGSDYPDSRLPDSFEEWYAQVESANPALLYADGQLEVSRRQVKLAAAEGLPKLSVGYVKESVVGGERFQGVAAGISIPLWENKNRTKQARVQVKASEAALRDAKIRLHSSLQILYLKACDLRQAAASYRATLEACNSELLLKKALDAGEISLLTYLQEMEFYYAAVSSALATERDFALAVAEMKAAESVE
jgi:CzcA family heavy metal efflux pump